MSSIWFTSDTHYNHKNIVRGVSSWGKDDNSTRDFKTLEEHNQTLVHNINSLVKENDTMWHLGDWSFGGIESIWNFRKQLRCKNIHLILGNHDHHIESNSLLPNCYSNWNKEGFPIESGDIKDNFEDEEKFGIYSSNEIFAREIFKSVQHVFDDKIGNTKFFLSHYSHRVWPGGHKNVIHLYGHSHGTLPDYSTRINRTDGRDFGSLSDTKLYKSMDVGLDTNNLKPYHIDEILKIMDKRVPLRVDHHNDKTTQ